jgi:hypothetical protein
MYIKLQGYMKPQGRRSLNHIMIPHDDLPPHIVQLWQSIYDPVLLEALILEQNRKHFSQAKGTPFTKGILSMIPFSGTMPVAYSILNGTMQVNNPIVQLVLNNLKLPNKVQPIQAAITIEERKGKFDNWKGTTSTSPTTKHHIGHYQCLTQMIDQDKDADKPDQSVIQAKKVINTHFLLVAYSVKFGISLTRWQNVVNSMIEKEPGNPKIH